MKNNTSSKSTKLSKQAKEIYTKVFIEAMKSSMGYVNDYIGGHIYNLTDEQRQILIDTIDNFTPNQIIGNKENDALKMLFSLRNNNDDSPLRLRTALNAFFAQKKANEIAKKTNLEKALIIEAISGKITKQQAEELKKYMGVK